MSSNKEHIAKMNRSGQRKGAVGSNPTRCTLTVLRLKHQGRIDRYAPLLDFGAGKWAQQTAILRDAGFQDVTPYDMGENGHHEAPEPVGGWPVIMMSNVLNVQGSIEDIRELAAQTWGLASARGLMVCNYPRSPRYSNASTQEVLAALEEAGWGLLRKHKGAWILMARFERPSN